MCESRLITVILVANVYRVYTVADTVLSTLHIFSFNVQNSVLRCECCSTHFRNEGKLRHIMVKVAQDCGTLKSRFSERRAHFFLAVY